MTKGRGKRGGSRGKSKPSMRDISRRRPAEDEWDDLFLEIRTQTDRGVALIAGSLVDATLMLALQSKMHEGVKDEMAAVFEDVHAPLATFSSRITIGWALGIFGPVMRARLNTIRSIRNTFAHALVPITFIEPLIAKECATLPLHIMEEPPLPEDWSESRKRYVMSCYAGSHDLVGWALRHGGGAMTIELD